MAQSKKRRTGIEETVKLIQQTDSGELLRVLEFGINEIIEAEFQLKVRKLFMINGQVQM